jgi:RHS repeat-associated protein
MVEELEWDAAGNLKSLEAYDDGRISHAESWTYNWRHQPTTFSRTVATSQLFSGTITYRYDALGRRIARVENGTETRFVYDGGRVIEERRGADDSVLASYVHGAYIDDVVTMRRAVPQGGIPADWFFHSDDQFSVSAVTNAAGALAERVAYGDFGAPTFLSPGGTAMVVSAIGNPYAFTGRRWDAAERTYHYRFRTFSPGLGRFTTRDPIGIWGDALNLGNGYTYTGNDPWSWVDPWGFSSLWSRCPTLIQDSITSLFYGGRPKLGPGVLEHQDMQVREMASNNGKDELVGAINTTINTAETVAVVSEVVVREATQIDTAVSLAEGVGHLQNGDLAAAGGSAAAMLPIVSGKMLGKAGHVAEDAASLRHADTALKHVDDVTPPNLGNLKVLSDHKLKGINAHDVKHAVYSRKAKVKLYDLHEDPATGLVWVIRRDGSQSPVCTGFTLEDLRTEFPK